MEIGHTYSLKVAREVDFGLYLESELGDILLPVKYVPEGTKPGDTVDVFVHRDSEDRLLATTLRPAGEVGEMVPLKTVDLTVHGAFMDWGLEKDLFVPKNEQHVPFRVGQTYVVMILVDHRTDRLIGTSKLNSFLRQDNRAFQEGEEVEALIYEKTELGFKGLIGNNQEGLLYASEVFEDIAIGDSLPVTIDKIREDGKIDLRRHPAGFAAIDRHTDSLLEQLQKNDGFLPLTDRSSPEEIREQVKMSKKAFKKALGGLYKKRMVVLEDKGIRLVH